MVRTSVITSLLIVALLVCPFRCWGAIGGEASAPSVARCACCANVDVASPERSSSEGSTPAKTCDCPNCLCDGALLGDGKLVLDVAPAEAALGNPIGSVSPANPAEGPIRILGRNDDGPPGGPTGRAVRVRHQSLVI